ncbi:aldehyde dehydrogenase family protein [Pseudonocardia terrae]|uniref:aldehyde dehydrogenase family protein n=1 Tax=Pseudonocardia terrae TaxID=2905831 RepID=UPI003FD7E89F
MSSGETIEAGGVPAGALNIVHGTGPVVGEAIAGHPAVDMVSFTGSTRAGKRVSVVAADTITRVALDLGGAARRSSPGSSPTPSSRRRRSSARCSR